MCIIRKTKVTLVTFMTPSIKPYFCLHILTEPLNEKILKSALKFCTFAVSKLKKWRGGL